jgi:hypothetical protein
VTKVGARIDGNHAASQKHRVKLDVLLITDLIDQEAASYAHHTHPLEIGGAI